MNLNRPLARLTKERERLQQELQESPAYQRLQKIETAIQVLQELDGGATARAKVKQLGKLVQAAPAPTNGRVYLGANGKPLRRLTRTYWEPQILAFLRSHPESDNVALAEGLGWDRGTTNKRLRDLTREKLVARFGKSGRGFRPHYALTPKAETVLAAAESS